ncbi:MAG TPA: hypothetical protein GX717_06870 [Clostridiaceae bacterium]|nr:hypothetical protein [Clostridiaceae bacterium]
MAKKRTSKGTSENQRASRTSTEGKNRRSSRGSNRRQLALEDIDSDIETDVDQDFAAQHSFDWWHFFTRNGVGRIIFFVLGVALLVLIAILLSKNQMETFYMWIGIFLLVGIVIRIILFYRKHRQDEVSNSIGDRSESSKSNEEL